MKKITTLIITTLDGILNDIESIRIRNDLNGKWRIKYERFSINDLNRFDQASFAIYRAKIMLIQNQNEIDDRILSAVIRAVTNARDLFEDIGEPMSSELKPIKEKVENLYQVLDAVFDSIIKEEA